jgi:hypothetical protein
MRDPPDHRPALPSGVLRTAIICAGLTLAALVALGYVLGWI